MKTELLSPAKDKYTAFGAIDCGADAVYIGAPAFGARQNASNSLEDIRDVVNYAHKFWVKVFVTVNTILTDEELKKAVELIKKLDEIGVDAIIVQDMGILNYFIQNSNTLESLPVFHMSTQCNNRDAKKVKFFNDIGVSRVVLARELSLEQIKNIHKENPNLELECFIHGALCVSYSGQCYLSQYIGGRSANRGECAQPCRKKYSVIDDKNNVIAKDIHALCLKDFNASKHIKEMVGAGVFSFKIEGRLKDIGYVKNITSYYRQELDKYSEKISSGKSIYPFTPNPEKSFNRGFTDYFLTGRTDCYNLKSPKSRGEYIGEIIDTKKDYFTLKTNIQINSQDGLCFYTESDLEGFLVNKTDLSLKEKSLIKVYPNKNIKLTKGTNIYRNNDVEFEKELLKPVKRQIGINVKYQDGILSIIDENGISIEKELPQQEEAKNKEKMNETFIKQFSKTGESDFYISDIKIASDLPFMPVSQINELRRNLFKELINKRLKAYKKDIQKPLKYTKYYKDTLDYRENIYNREAEYFYKQCGSEAKEWSFEKQIPDKPAELMRTKHCIKYALNMCKSHKKLFLKDEKGIKYPLIFDCKSCEMSMLHNLFRA